MEQSSHGPQTAEREQNSCSPVPAQRQVEICTACEKPVQPVTLLCGCNR